MPIDEKELDGFAEPKWRHVFAKMEKGKFYTLGEMSEKILGRNIIPNGSLGESLSQYLPEELRKQRMVPTSDIQVALVSMSIDISNVISFLHSQLALENIRQGVKNGAPYFGLRLE